MAALHQHHVRPSLAGRVRQMTVLLFMFDSAFALLLPRFPLPPAVPRFFYNGTFASQTCLDKFACGTAGDNLPECSCHPKCALFDECCEDIRPDNWRQLMLPVDSYQCTPVLLADTTGAPDDVRLIAIEYIYVITKCPPAYDRPHMRQLCERPPECSNNGTSPALVTDYSTGLTYGNRFCAFCNGVNQSDEVSWTVQQICAEEPPLGLTGCQQRWLKPSDIVDLVECKASYIRNCSSDSLPSLQAACTDNPVKRIYDSTDLSVYRNYNCSLCYDRAASDWSCTGRYISYAVAPIASLKALPSDCICPKQVPVLASAEEQEYLASICPGIAQDAGNCSDMLSPTALSVMYASNPTEEYNFTSEGVRVRFNSSYSACTECKTAYRIVSENDSWYANSTPGSITMNGTTYSLPFFKVMDGGYVAICSKETSDLRAGTGADPRSLIIKVVISLSLIGLAFYAVAIITVRFL